MILIVLEAKVGAIYIYSYVHKHFTIKLVDPFFNSCERGVDKPWEWMYQYANSWRIEPDHHHDWTSTAAIVEDNADLGDYAGINTVTINNINQGGGTSTIT